MPSRRRSRSSPVSSSRLASSPTTRKKKVISPWLTHCRRSREMPSLPRRIESFVVQNDSYESGHGELAHKSAATAAASNTMALPVSVVRKSRTGAARFRAQAVRPESEPGPPVPAWALPAAGQPTRGRPAPVALRPTLSSVAQSPIPARIDPLGEEEHRLWHESEEGRLDQSGHG